MARTAVVALTVLAVLTAWTGQLGAQLATYEKSELVIETASGAHRFTVEMAVTPEQKTQGLMFRTSLPSDAGMLFDYQVPQPVSMWMRNTLIPLDMLFVGADGRIVNVRERAVPHSLESIPSTGPVRAVIELNGGTVARLGIKPGDRVRHPIFGNGG